MKALPAASARRRARLLLRRSQRALRRHYWSAVTLVMLIGALALVLRSPGFDGGAVEKVSPVAIPQRLTPAEFLSSLKPNQALPGYRITFYLYTHEAQRRSLEALVREDLLYLRSQGYPDGVLEGNFLPVRDAAEEEAAILLIRDVGSWVAGRGIHLSVIDLR